MRRVCATLAGLALATCVPFTAAAQTPAAQAPAAPAPASAPMAGRFSIGAIVGAAVVQNVSGAFGGEVSFALTDMLDVFGEGVSMQDVVTRRQLDLVPTVTNFLQTSQGKTATGELTAPAGYVGAGLRITLAKGKIQPYLAFSAGAGKVTLKPVFTLGGTDVTATLPQYGVSLGSDLTGETTSAAFSGGGGVRMNMPRWYVDGGLRLTSIRTPDQPTNVVRVEARVGVRF